MGKLLSVWSPTKKCGRTIVTYNLVKNIAELLPEKKILVLCINMNYGSLLPLYEIGREELTIEKAVNYKLSETASDLDYTKVLANKGNLYFMGSQNTTLNYSNRNLSTYERVVNELKATFDFVIVDTCAGKNIPLSNMILDNCTDGIVSVLMQDNEVLQSEFTNEKSVAYVINFYRDIYPSVTEIKNKYSVNNIYELPSCNILQDMKNKNRLDLYNQYGTDFSMHIKTLALHILKKLNFSPVDIIEQKANKKEKKNKKEKEKKGSWLW